LVVDRFGGKYAVHCWAVGAFERQVGPRMNYGALRAAKEELDMPTSYGPETNSADRGEGIAMRKETRMVSSSFAWWWVSLSDETRLEMSTAISGCRFAESGWMSLQFSVPAESGLMTVGISQRRGTSTCSRGCESNELLVRSHSKVLGAPTRRRRLRQPPPKKA